MIKSNLEPIEEGDFDLRGKLEHGSGIDVREEAPVSPEKEQAQEISAAEKDAAYSRILSKVQNPQQTNAQVDPMTVAQDAQDAARITAESQVQHLIAIAQQKGVVHAVKVAQHLQDNYVLDTMHDRMLADELHDALIAKGMIKEL